MILDRERRAEERHDAVAHDPVHRTLVAVDGLGHAFEHRVEQQSLRGLGIAVDQQLHRTRDIGEQHGDLLPLTLEGRPRGQDLFGKVLGPCSSWARQTGYRPQRPAREWPHPEQNLAVDDTWLPHWHRLARAGPHTPRRTSPRGVLVVALRAQHGNPPRKHRPGCAVTLAPLVDGDNLHTTLGQGNQANLRGPSTVVLNETVALPHLHDRRHLAMGELRMTLDWRGQTRRDDKGRSAVQC